MHWPNVLKNGVDFMCVEYRTLDQDVGANRRLKSDVDPALSFVRFKCERRHEDLESSICSLIYIFDDLLHTENY